MLLFAKMHGGTQNQSLSCFAPETSGKEKEKVLEGPYVLLLRQTVELGQRSPAGKFLFPFSLRNSVVAVVQAAQPCAPDDPAIQRRSHPPTGSLLVESEMCAVFVIVADVFAEKAFQVPLVEHDHMIEQIAAAALHPTLGNSILPGASE